MIDRIARRILVIVDAAMLELAVYRILRQLRGRRFRLWR